MNQRGVLPACLLRISCKPAVDRVGAYPERDVCQLDHEGDEALLGH